MIPVSSKKVELNTWQYALQNAVSDVKTLLSLLSLEYGSLPNNIVGTPDFPIKVPYSFVTKMIPNNPLDPLLLQVLASGEELNSIPGFTKDPVLEQSNHNQTPGLIHKYPGRVLFILSAHCAINCRYCFRRNFPYEKNRPGKMGWQKIIDDIRKDDSIYEVILSGGDPLSVSNNYLNWVIDALNQIPHLKMIRLHTRFPVVIPERIDKELVNILSNSKKPIVMVLHINHPNEIDAFFKTKMQLLKNNITLLNQSVLLKQINDEAKVLRELSFKLFDCHIMPYYLHVLDKVKGAHHFAVEENQIRQIYQSLSAMLPGYLLPKLVQEIPGRLSKTLVGRLID